MGTTARRGGVLRDGAVASLATHGLLVHPLSIPFSDHLLVAAGYHSEIAGRLPGTFVAGLPGGVGRLAGS